MGKYTFIINVGNAIDKSHFRMYFLESISKRKLSMYDIEDMSELTGKIVHASKHIDRNMFEADKNDLIICVPRSQESLHTLLYWTFYLKSYIYNAIPERAMRKINHIYLLIVDNTENEFSSDNSIDQIILERGYLDRDVYEGRAEIITKKELADISYTYASSNSRMDETSAKELLDKIQDAGFRQVMITALERYKTYFKEYQEGDGSAVFSFFETFSDEHKKYSNQLKTIEHHIIPVSESNLAAKRISQLQIVTFLVNCVNDDISGVSFPEMYQRHLSSYDPAAEAYRLNAYNEKIREQNASFERRKDKTGIKYSSSYMHEIGPIEPKDVIGGNDDIDKLFDEVTDISSSDDLDEKFEKMLHEIESYEDRLREYGKTLSECFHQSKINATSNLKSFENEKAEDEKADAELELSKAGEKAYRQRDNSNNTYAVKVDIANQFVVIGNCMKKLQSARSASARNKTPELIAFALFLIIIPYSIMQTYIYGGLIKGNFIPLICISVLILTVLLAKPLASFLMERSFNKEIKKLKDLVEKYFVEIRQRQELFHENVNSMIAIWNAEQRLEACNKAIAQNADERMRVEYHKNAIKNNLNLMSYFSSFIDNYNDIDESYSIHGAKGKLDMNKGATNNPMYWIGTISK